MNKDKFMVSIDDFGNMTIPKELKSRLKPNMILTFFGSDTLVALPLERLESIGMNLPKKERINLLRSLKANSTPFVIDNNSQVNIPDYILEKITFKNGIVVFNQEGNFKIVGIVDEMEVKHGK